MSAAVTLDRLRAAGAVLSLAPGGRVRFVSAVPLPPDLLAEARAEREAIAALLPEAAAPPMPRQPPGDRLSGAAHPVSWADASIVPANCCRCCGGWRWWCEVMEPSGWRCATCHPAPALPGYQARVVTVAEE